MKKPDISKFALYSLLGITVLIVLLVLKIVFAEANFNFNFIPSFDSGAINLWAIFLTGLLAGGMTCLAVQGGLLAATIAQREQDVLEQKTVSSGNLIPISSFLVSKIVAYTILGLLLGWLGSFFEFSIMLKAMLQAAVGIFMIGTALNLLHVHPIFRYFIIQPPKFLTRMVRNQSKSKAVFAPALLGAFTIFIPCGTTQAIMALSIATGDPFVGATVLFIFTLGTSPIFFVLGYFASKLGDGLQKRFMKVAAYAIILIALFNLNNAIALTGSRFTLENTISLIFGNDSFKLARASVSEATIEFFPTYYSPNLVTVKAGSNVKLNLVNTYGDSCVQAFTIPALGIQKIVPVGTSDYVEFKAPSTTGQISFMCGMGMFRGVINVI